MPIGFVLIGVIGTGSLPHLCSTGGRGKRKCRNPEQAARLKAEDGPEVVHITSIQSVRN